MEFSKIIIFLNRTILHYACEYGNIAIVSYLLSLAKFDINERDIDLHYQKNGKSTNKNENDAYCKRN